ncbi:hypothetical protein CH363_13615 [Leptospira haakeii]|uniref:DUF304 domain-containing protein n=1 Tax=Leptospira haakeii TaxID=2023198 RepID=A0ABX4PKQ2_9LEPT|nr:hypothetical protein CH363_13615 [Leptospira haakeii]
MNKHKSYRFRSQTFFLDSLVVFSRLIVIVFLSIFLTKGNVVIFIILFLIISVLIRVTVWFFSPRLEILITDDKFLYKQYYKNRVLSSGYFSKDEIKYVYLQYYQWISTIALETISGKVIWFECYGWDKYSMEEIKEKLNDKRNSLSLRLSGIFVSRFLLQSGIVYIIAGVFAYSVM